MDTISGELDEVTDACFAILVHEGTATQGEATGLVDGLTNAITGAPLSPSSLPLIMSGWTGLEGLMNTESTTTIALRQQRCHIMLINYTAFYWLDVFIVDQCKELLKGRKVSESLWLASLVSDIDVHCRSGKEQTINLRAVDYGIDLPNAIFPLNRGYVRVPKDEERIAMRIAKTVVCVLERWLKYPSEGSARQKAWFVHFIVTEFGVNTLYLDGIWNVHSSIRGRLFKDGDWRLESFKVVRSLDKATLDHPLRNPASPERVAIDNMAELINNMSSGNNKHFVDGSHIPDSESALFRDTLSPTLRSIADKEITLFKSFIQQNLNYVTSITWHILTCTIA